MSAPYYADDSVTLWPGDCLDVMRGMADNSVDSVVTDPPYGLGFMGRDWDDLPPGLPWAQECLRVLKPGGHLLAFGGTRTWHRLAVAVEDAGFEVRDSIAWLYGSGFAKSHNLSNIPAEKSPFCTCPALPLIHDGDGDMRGVRSVVPDAGLLAQACEGADLFAPVQRGAAGSGVGDARTQGGSGEDARELRGSSGQDARAAEPGVEGRRDAQAGEGQLRGSAVRPLPAGVAVDGEVGRVHLGAPSSDGAVGGPTADPLGVREPRQPRPVGQPSGEPGPLADERGPQARRGWPLCGGCGKQRVVGLGTALKPAFEPIVVGRKPLSGTVAANVLKWGTGALNVDACRTGSVDGQRPKINAWEPAPYHCVSCAELAEQSGRLEAPARRASTATRPAAPTTSARDEPSRPATHRTATGCSDGTTAGATSTSSSTEPCGSSTTGESSPTGTSSTTSTATSRTTESTTCTSCGVPITPATTTSESRSGRWPSNVVLDDSQAAELDRQSGTLHSQDPATRKGRDRREPSMAFGERTPGESYSDSGGASRFFPTFRYEAKAPTLERPRDGDVAHPTVKPLDLMRWLVRLVTPPGGIVLEPFAGSGTTAEACVVEGFRCIAIERESAYLPLIVARLSKPIALDLFGGAA